MENTKYPKQEYKYETVRQFCRRWQVSRRKFDMLKSAGLIGGIVQTGPRFIRIRPDLADASLEKYMTGGAS